MAAWVPTGRVEGRALSGTSAICLERFSASAMRRPRQAPGPARHVELFASQFCSCSKPAAAELGRCLRTETVAWVVEPEVLPAASRRSGCDPTVLRAGRVSWRLGARPRRWRSLADGRQESQGRDITTSVMAVAVGTALRIIARAAPRTDPSMHC